MIKKMNSRYIVLKILNDIENGGYSNIVLDRYLKKIKDKRNKALITEIVYGVLRFRNRLDFIIKHLSNIPLNKIDSPVLQGLRVGIYQLEILDKIPERAAVNETVDSVKSMTNRGGVGFVNGILRNFSRKKSSISFPDAKKDIKSYLVNYLSHPEWLVEYWLKKYGPDTTLKLCEYNNKPGELTIRINKLKYSEQEFLNIYQKAGIQLQKTVVAGNYRLINYDSIKELPLYNKGGFMVQGIAATLTGHIMNPQPGMRVLDMAAGPGGKTTHLAELMDNRGEIVAIDIYNHKLKMINENCRRLGVEIVKTINADSRYISDIGNFDMVLVDAPCSGLGLIRQKPEIKWIKDIQDIKDLSIIQLELLKKAVEIVKNNGIIVYSTCTLIDEENRAIIEKIIENNKKRLEIIDLNQELNENIYNHNSCLDKYGSFELIPPFSKTEGFFITKLKKR